jgi:hypothetical protein
MAAQKKTRAWSKYQFNPAINVNDETDKSLASGVKVCEQVLVCRRSITHQHLK